MMEWVYTFTVDVSHNQRHRTTGIGLVIQRRLFEDGRPDGRRGPIIDQLSEQHQGIHSSVVDAFAILRALEIALERGYARVRVRSDCNHERTQLRQWYRNQDSARDPVRARILELARRLIWADFKYIPRHKNHIAHCLARAARFVEQGASSGSSFSCSMHADSFEEPDPNA